MSAGKELLTDVLDGVLSVQVFLTEGLAGESLSPDCEAQRQNTTRALKALVKKIQNAHPSIRPRVNTPGNLKKPPPPPPSSSGVPEPPASDDEGEVYEEPVSDCLAEGLQKAEDYLEYSHANSNGMMEEEGEQEVYEAMESGHHDMYEEPVNSSVENYEDPINSRPNNKPSTSSPLPGHSESPQQEKLLEEVEYAETIATAQQQVGMADVSMDWGTVYTTPPKGGAIKVSALSHVKIKGPLEKLGGKNRKSWQKRYCVLSGGLMYFYEKESSRTFNNCIVVLSFKVSTAPNITNEKKKQFGFKLTQEDSCTGKNKDYYFRSSTAEHRDKWVGCIKNTEKPALVDSLLSPSAYRQASSVTLPRMPSHAAAVSPPMVPRGARRARSEGEDGKEEEEEEEEEEEGGEEGGELYEAMAEPEDGREMFEEEAEISDDEYIDMCIEDKRSAELESSEEYVSIIPAQLVDQGAEVKEAPPPPPILPPPPPILPPPGAPSEVFTHPLPQAVPSFKPATPPPSHLEPEMDTNKVYLNDNSNEIVLERVYVSQWNFEAMEGDELRLKRGDLVYVSRPLDSEMWWYGELLDAGASTKVGLAGLFPKDYSTLAFETLPC